MGPPFVSAPASSEGLPGLGNLMSEVNEGAALRAAGLFARFWGLLGVSAPLSPCESSRDLVRLQNGSEHHSQGRGGHQLKSSTWRSV